MFGWLTDLLNDIAQGDYLFVVALTLLAAWAVWRLYYRFYARENVARYPRFFGLSLQIGMTLMLERIYEFSRGHVIVSQLTDVAYSNGYKLLDFEMGHGFFVESRIQHLFLGDNLLMHGVDAFYAFAHLFVTLGFLIWLYVRRNEAFGFVRNVIYVATGIALVVYMTFPTAPPRYFTQFFVVDPSTSLGLTPAGGAQLTSYTYNPFAAMPSLHLVYALIVGAGLFFVGRHLWLRAIGAIYPFVMLAVVLISANHWILDAVGAVVTVALATLMVMASRRTVSMVRSLVPNRPLSSTG
jgi:PAP2 superfamily